MKFLAKKTRTARHFTSAWLSITLLALSLIGAGVTANSNQDKPSQDNNVEAAKRFVGTWKGKSRPDMIIDNVLIFKMDGDRLKGTIREFAIHKSGDSEPRIVRDEYVALPDLKVEGKTLSWKASWNQPDHETLRRVTLLSDDEILYEFVGMNRLNDQPTLILPMSFKLKREK